MFIFKSPFSRKSSGKEIVDQGVLPIFFMVLVLGATFLAKRVGTSLLPKTMLMRSEMVYGEMSDPFAGRLIYGIILFVVAVILAKLAIIFEGKGKSKTAFKIGFTGGTLLWCSVGECLWHFEFLRIETAASFPFVILFSMLMFYLMRRNALDFGLLVYILSFLTNWFGHFVLMGPYRLVSGIMSESMCYMIMGIVIGTLFFLFCTYLLVFASENMKARMIASIGIYISIGVAVFGVIG